MRPAGAVPVGVGAAIDRITHGDGAVAVLAKANRHAPSYAMSGFMRASGDPDARLAIDLAVRDTDAAALDLDNLAHRVLVTRSKLRTVRDGKAS